jgi:hypothetical protein
MLLRIFLLPVAFPARRVQVSAALRVLPFILHSQFLWPLLDRILFGTHSRQGFALQLLHVTDSFVSRQGGKAVSNLASSLGSLAVSLAHNADTAVKSTECYFYFYICL